MQKVPVTTKRIWMRVADPSSSRRRLSVSVVRRLKKASAAEDTKESPVEVGADAIPWS